MFNDLSLILLILFVYVDFYPLMSFGSLFMGGEEYCKSFQ